MKKITVILSIVVVLLLMATLSSRSYAQISNIGSFIQSGTEDANLLARSYLNPVGKGFGPALNAGWINSATPHKLLGFDISLKVGLSLVPKSDQTFNATNLVLHNLTVKNTPISPTVSGPSHSGTTFEMHQTVNGQEYSAGEFTMPGGTGFSVVPAPMLQAGIGLIKHTELIIRYLPKTSIHDYGDMNLFGVGLRHSINQWLPGGKILPVNLSILAAYTSFHTNSPLKITPQVNSHTDNPYSDETWKGQKVKSQTSAFTINAIVGKSLPFIGFFAGLGYETSKVKLSTPGSYPVTTPDPTPADPQHQVVTKVDEPISVSMDGANSFRGLIGLQLKLAFFHINAEYVLSTYQVLSGGISFGFR